jgi:7-keto-8-aminopelargonate synthetase-like enzyme
MQLQALGVSAGIRAYPIVPPDSCGLRFGLTRLHTEQQIDQTIVAIGSVVKSVTQKIKRSGA